MHPQTETGKIADSSPQERKLGRPGGKESFTRTKAGASPAMEAGEAVTKLAQVARSSRASW